MGLTPSSAFSSTDHRWREYYVVQQIQFDDRLTYLKNHGKWAIFFNDRCEQAGKVAYQAYYRNERLANKGAERLYRREHGAMEEALLGSS